MNTKRERKVDVNKLTDEELQRASDLLGKRISKICDKAADEVNNILKIYGLETKLQFLTPYPIGQPPSQE